MNIRATIKKGSLLLAAASVIAAGAVAAAPSTAASTASTAASTTNPSVAPTAAATPGVPAVANPAVPAPPSGSRWMTPKAVVLRKTTVTEEQANAIWNLRAALNIAALQCQYLPELATVATYNSILRVHVAELNRARLTMLAHFKRHDGAKAQNSFDQYTTRTYNSYSTLDAQKAFCEASAKSGQEVLALPAGSLKEAAPRLVPEIRQALAEPVKPAPAIMTDTAPVPDPLAPAPAK